MNLLNPKKAILQKSHSLYFIALPYRAEVDFLTCLQIFSRLQSSYYSLINIITIFVKYCHCLIPVYLWWLSLRIITDNTKENHLVKREVLAWVVLGERETGGGGVGGMCIFNKNHANFFLVFFFFFWWYFSNWRTWN